MAHHTLPMPITEDQVRALRIGDTVTLEEILFGIRDATQIHMFDHGRATRFDLRGHAVIHTAPNLRKVERSGTNHSGYEAVCVGTTTSDRMERFTRPLMERERVRIIIGKGGLREGSLDAFRELGGVYLAVVGGAAALETTWIEAVEDVDLDDLNPESLYKFRIKGFGPLLVAMDSHGGSLYATVNAEAAKRRRAVLEKLGGGMSLVAILLPLLVLFQVLPPPLGQVALVLIVGRAYGTDRRDVPVPEPRLQSAPAEDCNCGLPSSPRGPR